MHLRTEVPVPLRPGKPCRRHKSASPRRPGCHSYGDQGRHPVCGRRGTVARILVAVLRAHLSQYPVQLVLDVVL